MSISRGDRFNIVCFIAGIETFPKFKKAFWRQQGDNFTDSKVLRKAFLRWKRGGSIQSNNEGYLVEALKASGWPQDLPDPEDLLKREIPVSAFLDLCKLSYERVQHLLSRSAQEDWAAGHHNLHFMKALDEQAARNRAKVLLPVLKGTYRLYRRHSVLPGLLREYLAIDEIKEGHCEGWYIQYARAHPANLIPFNAFVCEFYIIAFGAHLAVERRTEIVTVSVLVENAFSDGKLVRPNQSRHFIGLLTGIYDYGNVLLAERILIEKVSSEVQIEKDLAADGKWQPRIGRFAPVHIHADSDKKLRGEYYKAIDVIDNSLDGQTLAVRPDRLELVRD